MVVEFRRRTMLPLDDMLGHLHECLPQLSRSALHRCLVRHGISLIPKNTNAAKRGKFTYVAFFDAATKRNGATFLRQAIEAFPYRIHTVLTDNGVAFTELPRHRGGATNRFGGHIFDRVCYEHNIKHCLTKPYHPWTNGQVERMNRTIKEATVKVFHYPDFDALKAHVLAFVMAYNFARYLKALRWRTPFKVICEAWTQNPDRFTINPHHLIPGPNT
ncbi:transposase [Pseudomonas chlororaphis subsp. aurantiaca]|nr:transposase [Pseudomonas chlororaphis subsp. aurantiaca]